ncbi:MAG: hypothetical protein SFV32_08660 [Opitutaceae bacterium]|nr:hypothetical protein [Opitutaceae bacterium]
MSEAIKQSLGALVTAISSGDGEVLKREMTFLDSQVSGNSAQLHPQLLHFLKNRSYAKALMWVNQEPNIPAGVCGGRAGQAPGKLS